MAKKSKKSAAGSKRKKAKLRKTLSVVISIIVLVLAIIWYFGGKPVVEIGAEGVTLVQTEEPLAAHIPEILSGEYPPEVEYAEGQGIPSPAEPKPVQKSVASEPESGAPEVRQAQQPQSEGKKNPSANRNISSSSADLGYSENDPLFFGNPTDALADTSLNSNYLMIKPQFTLSYNTQTLGPNWVAWHLDSQNMGEADRSDDFRPDTELPAEWYAVKKADYQYNKYGFDRGHVCPSADRTATKEDNSMTFLMTNMVPQTPDNNRVIWMHFENFERELVKAGNEVYIIAGPHGTGGTTPKGTFDNIPITLKSGDVLYMNVPAYTWKVLIAIPDGTDDLDRIDSSATVIAINVPNQTGMQKTGDWEQFLCSIDDIEAMTGYDFFELLPDDVEDSLERSVYNP
ncbi:MAG: DNA/RNA non-specific endonuclease [Treponema sp.]|nr:DNA/RNA non-specific endonuclease [Treponema sp.]